jgi:hypothetical protein
MGEGFRKREQSRCSLLKGLEKKRRGEARRGVTVLSLSKKIKLSHLE